MKKHIDKSCLQGNNVITLIKRFIKHKIKQYKKEETIMLQQVMTNPGAFFKKCRENYDAVIHFNISSDFSSCYQNACTAAAEFENVYALEEAI